MIGVEKINQFFLPQLIFVVVAFVGGGWRFISCIIQYPLQLKRSCINLIIEVNKQLQLQLQSLITLSEIPNIRISNVLNIEKNKIYL